MRAFTASAERWSSTRLVAVLSLTTIMRFDGVAQGEAQAV